MAISCVHLATNNKGYMDNHMVVLKLVLNLKISTSVYAIKVQHIIKTHKKPLICIATAANLNSLPPLSLVRPLHPSN